MSISLNQFYKAIGTSKQALHQRLNRILRKQSYEHQLLYLIYELRNDHPTMGSRDMYYLLRPDFIGRDRFESFCKLHGLSSKRPVNYRKTTNSNGVIRFPNLILDMEVNTLNQVWVSDITYYEVNASFFYATFIMDIFSRRIIGHKASEFLFTEQTTLPALEMSLSVREGMDINGVILHSDGGGQYYDGDFLKLTQQKGIRNSMCAYPWDNGYAERINGVIKNNYLKHRSIDSFKDFQREVDRSVQLYNEEKPHISLNRLSPIEFENVYLQSKDVRR